MVKEPQNLFNSTQWVNLKTCHQINYLKTEEVYRIDVHNVSSERLMLHEVDELSIEKNRNTVRAVAYT